MTEFHHRAPLTNASALLLLVFLGMLFLTLSAIPQQGGCTNSTGCNNLCRIPQSNTGNLPGETTYTVCTDQSILDLGNPNLSTAVNNMVSGWNSVLSSSPGAPVFQTGTSDCDVTVTAGLPDDPTDVAQWDFTRDAQGNITGGTVTLGPGPAASWSSSFANAMLLHELGHGLGLGNAGSADNCSQADTAMYKPFDPNSPVPCTPTDCDDAAAEQQYPPPSSELPPGCEYDETCTNWDWTNCQCLDLFFDPGYGTPIILAVGQSSDYHLTGANDGVFFDINADGKSERVAWTRAEDLIGFLVLDRNGNGLIDHGRELFGNYTPLEGDATAAHGFEALAYWDRTDAGGNGDGWIDTTDSVWANLQVWVDSNHDGLSQPSELFPLAAFNITRISTLPLEEKRRDHYGNLYHLKGQFIINGHPRWAYDVFFAVIR